MVYRDVQWFTEVFSGLLRCAVSRLLRCTAMTGMHAQWFTVSL